MSATAATVAGVPVTVDEVDAREAVLRAGPVAATLPRPGTSEGRQLRRWLTQLLVTERVVASEAAALGVTRRQRARQNRTCCPTRPRAWRSAASPRRRWPTRWRRALFGHVTADVDVADDDVADYHARNPRRAFVRHRPRGAAASSRARSAPGAAPSGCGSTRAAPRWSGSLPVTSIPAIPRQPDNTHRH